MSEIAPVATATCTACGSTKPVKPAVDGKPKSPPKWRRIGERLLCPACASAGYVTRAITLPVDTCVSHPWAEYVTAQHRAWRDATVAVKLAVRQYAISDPPVRPGEPLPKWTPPAKAAYDAIRASVPELPSGSAAAVVQRSQQTYARQRIDLHRGERVLPGVRYPQPVPVRRQDYTLGTDAEGRLIASFRAASTAAPDAPRYTLRLREAGGFERNGALVRAALAGGDVVLGELAVDAIRKTGTAREAQQQTRDAGGGRRTSYQIVLRISAKLPVRQRAEADGTLLVRTDPESLLVWRVAGGGAEDRPPLHCEQVRRQLVRFGREQAALRDDLKFEKRWPARVRRRMVERQNDLSRKRSNMLRTVCQQAAAMTVEFAARRRCARIEYDDAARSFAPTFPWHLLAEQLGQACRARGMEFAARASEAEVVAPVP